MADEYKKVEIIYDPNNNTAYIGASESDFDKRYLVYLLQHFGIPTGATLIFISKVESGHAGQSN